MAYYCTAKRINAYINHKQAVMGNKELKKALDNTLSELMEYPKDNKNQIRFFTKVKEKLK